MQLFTAYSLENPLFNNTVDEQSYGVDSDNDDIEEDSEREVYVPEISSPLSEENMVVLTTNINPLQDSRVYGVDLYISTIILVFALLENQTA